MTDSCQMGVSVILAGVKLALGIGTRMELWWQGRDVLLPTGHLAWTFSFGSLSSHLFRNLSEAAGALPGHEPLCCLPPSLMWVVFEAPVSSLVGGWLVPAHLPKALPHGPVRAGVPLARCRCRPNFTFFFCLVCFSGVHLFLKYLYGFTKCFL